MYLNGYTIKSIIERVKAITAQLEKEVATGYSRQENTVHTIARSTDLSEGALNAYELQAETAYNELSGKLLSGVIESACAQGLMAAYNSRVVTSAFGRNMSLASLIKLQGEYTRANAPGRLLPPLSMAYWAQSKRKFLTWGSVAPSITDQAYKTQQIGELFGSRDYTTFTLSSEQNDSIAFANSERLRAIQAKIHELNSKMVDFSEKDLNNLGFTEARIVELTTIAGL